MKRLGSSIPLDQRKSVLFVSSMDGYTGTGSLFDDMCKYMSIYNAPDLLGLPPRTPFGDERVLAMDPDYIFIPSYKGMDKSTTDLLRKGERKNQYSFQQRGGTGTYHGNLRYAKKVDDKKK